MIGFRVSARSRSLTAVLFALAAGVTVPAVAQESGQPLREEITVFEAQVIVDASGLGVVDKQRLKPENILLLEGGLPRRVTNMETLGQGGWRVLIYVDAPTSRARTVKLASQRLGSLAEALTDLGSVEVVVADPEPKVVVEATRQSTPLAERLANLSSSGIGGDSIEAMRDAFSEIEKGGLAPNDPRRAETLAKENTLVREQIDRLILRVARGCEGEPCILFLVSDGFYEDPESFYLGEHRIEGMGESRSVEEASIELAQTVAGYEWIALALPLREERGQSPVVGKPRSDFDQFLDHTGAVKRMPKASDKEPAIDWDKLEVSVTPILQSLVRLAATSGGAVVRGVDDLDAPIEALPSRRRVFYLTDRSLDGDLRAVSARIAQSGTQMGTPTWVRSSTPPAVAGARLRGALAGKQLDGGSIPITARIERGAAGQATLIVDAKWDPANAPLPQSAIRVSVGYQQSAGLPWVGHQRVRAGAIAEDGSWQHRLTLPLPAGVERVAVVAEALVPRTWGSASVEAPR